jgi:hypothetical protein
MKKVILTPAVEIALRSLDRDEVRRVRAWFDYLKRWDEDEVVRKNAVPLPGHEGVYVLLTTTDIRIFFTIESDTITVLDVAEKRTILTSAGITIGASAAVSPIAGGKKDE